MKTEKRVLIQSIPFILASLLPSIDYFNGNPNISLDDALIRWTIISFTLLTVWYINSYVSKDKALTILLTNIVFLGLISLFSMVSVFELPPIVIFPRILLPTILFITLQQSFKSIEDRKILLTENLLLKSETYKAELDNLKNQINPHFLFNSLATLQALIRSNSLVAEEYLVKLSEFYRGILLSSKEDKITLKAELDFIKSYIFLLESRFEKGLKITIDINENSLQYSLPIFALQLLIENCVKHNIVSDEHPLSINILQKNETSITVENGLNPKLKRENSTQTGLSNLSKRYELMGVKDGLIIGQNEKQFSVTLKLF